MDDLWVGFEGFRFDTERFSFTASFGDVLFGFEFDLFEFVFGGKCGLFGGDFGFDRFVKSLGKIEVYDVEVVDENAAWVQFVDQVGFDVIADKFAFGDEFFGSVLGGGSFDGFLESGVDQARFIVGTDFFVDLGDFFWFEVEVDGDRGVHGLKVF